MPVRTVSGRLAMAALLVSTACASGRASRTDLRQRLESMLTLWPERERHALACAVAEAAKKQAAPYATFDADGTLWSSDATESFIAYLDARGLLTPGQLDASVKAVPFMPDEGVYSYYQRLCRLDKTVGYPFCAQVFSGFSVAELRGHYAAMMRTHGSRVRVWKDGAFAEEYVATPRMWPRQAQLVRALEDCGVRVHIVTASPEELVRFLACSPACGAGFDLNLPPERVIGVNVLLRDGATGGVTSSRLRLRNAPRLFDAGNTREKWEQLRLTAFVVPPVTMQAGKVAAIAEFIDPVLPPVLAAGDSAGDMPMLFYSAGARVWVDHPYTPADTLGNAMKAYGNAPDRARGWVHGDWDTGGNREE